LADIHFAPTEAAVSNLAAENVPLSSIYLTGNTVIDALFEVSKRKFDLKGAGINLVPGRKMVLITAHRRESFGKPLYDICRAILRLSQAHRHDAVFIIPVHKNPLVRQTIHDLLGKAENVRLIEPLDYEPFVHLMKEAYLILTDSGGVQEEAPSLGKPVLVMREKTERPEAVALGAVKLVGLDEKVIFEQTNTLLEDKAAYAKMSRAVNPYGDGRAAERIIQAILYYFGGADRKPDNFKLGVLTR
jgi:UDP-N-acetylglucosamine 2-epimerase (non-hydrolysing)